VVAEARSALRGRLWLAAGQLDGLPLPGRLVGRVRVAIFAEIRRLAR
jgi:hypothetical protein